MDIIKSSFDKRQSVQKNYDLIAEQYSNEFGTYIEDLDVYEKFEQHLVENAKILDLGAGSGRTYSYFNKQNYEYIGLDFSKKMKDCAYNLHGKFPYIVDDIFSGRVAAAGDRVWILADDKLKEYQYANDAVTFVKDIPIGDGYSEITADETGNLYVSSKLSNNAFLRIKDGNIEELAKDIGPVKMQRSGKVFKIRF